MPRLTRAQVRDLETGVHQVEAGRVLRVGGRDVPQAPPANRERTAAAAPNLDTIRACQAITQDHTLAAELIAAIHTGTPADIATLSRTIRELQHDGPTALRAWITRAIEAPRPPVDPATLVEVYRAVRDARQPRTRR